MTEAIRADGILVEKWSRDPLLFPAGPGVLVRTGTQVFDRGEVLEWSNRAAC
jgi:hypothetical protein